MYIAMIILDKIYKKSDKCIRKSLDKAFEKLESRIKIYLSNNISLDRVFGDDILIHDIVNDNYYVYKTTVNNLQIRVLYTMNQSKNLVIVAHYIKKKNNKKYFEYFENCSKNIYV